MTVVIRNEPKSIATPSNISSAAPVNPPYALVKRKAAMMLATRPAPIPV